MEVSVDEPMSDTERAEGNSKINNSIFRKSYAGFDTGNSNAVGCFYSSMRAKYEKDNSEEQIS